MADYAGKTVLKFAQRTCPESDVYNGTTYLDVFNPKATERFIELTHEQYRKHCGERIGTTIEGIFTDEPHRGGLFSTFGAVSTYACPWALSLPQEYEKMFGGDLTADLPKLFLRENGERVNDVKWKFCELTQSLFLKNFAKPQYDWCTEHDMAYTGHVLHENNLTSQVTMQGSLMRYYEYMHTPGIDLLTENDNAYWVPKQLSSVARQLGQKWLLSEMYGCTGWQFDFENHKAVGDWQALFGINLRCQHLSWYTMEGEAKRDYPASIFFQSPWWKQYKYVEDYFSRLGVMLNQGAPVCDVLVVNPIESVWSQVCVRSFNGLSPAAPEIAEMEDKYADLFHWLAGERIDFDYGDEEMMSRLSDVGRDAEGNPIFRVGQASYRTVLVGNMETMRRSTLDALEKFEKEGGRVIFMGEAPKYVDVQPSDEPALMASRCVQVDYEEAPVVEAVKQAIRPVVEVRSAAGENLPLVFGQVRRDDERAYVVLMNIDRHRKYDSVSVTLPFEGEIALWDCKTGEVWKQPATASDGKSVVLTSFEPCEEKVYTISASAPAFAQTAPVYSVREKTELPDSYSYTLNEPNICVLDLATWQIGDEPVQPLTEILKIDRAVRTHFNLPWRGGGMLQPWYAEKHKGQEYTKPLGVLKMNFPFSMSVVPSDSVFLCLETPQRFTILVNRTAASVAGRARMVHRQQHPPHLRSVGYVPPRGEQRRAGRPFQPQSRSGGDLSDRPLRRRSARHPQDDYASARQIARGRRRVAGPAVLLGGRLLPDRRPAEPGRRRAPEADDGWFRRGLSGTVERRLASDMRMGALRVGSHAGGPERRTRAAERRTDAPQHVRAAASGPGAGRRIRAGELDDRRRLVHDGALHAASGRSDASPVAASRTAVAVRRYSR